jgi:hypothetical protein
MKSYKKEWAAVTRLGDFVCFVQMTALDSSRAQDQDASRWRNAGFLYQPRLPQCGIYLGKDQVE